MERNEHLKWCENCELRKPTMDAGLHCSATGKLADFEESCPLFEIDIKAFQANFRRSFQNSRTFLRKTWRGEVYSTIRSEWSRYNTVEQLPEVFVIKNSLYGGRALFYVLMIAVIILTLHYIDPGKLRSLSDSALSMAIVGLPIVLTLFVAFKSMLDRGPKITLYTSGIQLGKDPVLSWKNTATVIVESGKEDLGVALVVKQFEGPLLWTPIDQLEYKPSRIGHLVEMYKEKGRTSLKDRECPSAPSNSWAAVP